MTNTLNSLVKRLSFIAAFILMFLAVLDWIMRLFGYTLSFVPYQPGRMFEFAGILMLLIVVLLLREIRDNTKTR
jgi:preprotein translocase subunit SecY